MYLLASFDGANAASPLVIGSSVDGLHFDDVAVARILGVRDPSITIRATSPRILVAATIQESSQGEATAFKIFSGDTLSELQPAAEIAPWDNDQAANHKAVWAPEWFFDPVSQQLEILFTAGWTAVGQRADARLYSMVIDIDGSGNISAGGVPINIGNGIAGLDPFAIYDTSVTPHRYYLWASYVSQNAHIEYAVTTLNTAMNDGVATFIREGPSIVHGDDGHWYQYDAAPTPGDFVRRLLDSNYAAPQDSGSTVIHSTCAGISHGTVINISEEDFLLISQLPSGGNDVISFNSIPTTDRVPFVFVEFDNSGAIAPGPQQYTALMIGQKASAAPGAVNTPTLVTSLQQVGTYFGLGSQLYQMARIWFKNNQFTPLTIVAVADAGGATAASGSIAFTGPATAAGTLSLYIAGRSVQVGVPSGMTAAQLAAAVHDAINADTTLPVTAGTVSGGSVPITCNWAGLTGNDIDIRVNLMSGESTPAGITPTVTAMASGATNPTLTSAITAIGDLQYNIVVNPFTDSTSLTALAAELTRRSGPVLQADGVCFLAYKGTVGQLASFGAGQNSQYFCCMGVNKTPSPTYEVAAGVAAVAAYYGNIDPARPFQTLQVAGLVAPVIGDRSTMSDRNALLYDGISTYTVSPDGVFTLERLITMYRVNGAGAPDASYLDVCTVLTLSLLRYETRNTLLTKYPRCKLGDDDIRYTTDHAVVTPKVVRAEMVSLAQSWIDRGLVEGIDDFKAGLVVERNATDRNRLDVLLAPNLMNQFMVAGVQIRFIL